MAGIGAQSVTKTHAASGSDVAVSGFLKNEQIRLYVDGGASSYAWSIAVPSDSAPGRSALDSSTDATPAFTPDVAGFYTVAVVVNGSTSYVLRVAVAPVAIVRVAEGLNLMPLADAQVPTPQLGVTLYYSTDASAAVLKDTTGTVTPL
jgi:hypothetical protein